MAMAVIAVTLVTIPILIWFLIFDILNDGEEFYNRMKFRAVQIENEVWEAGGSVRYLQNSLKVL